MRPGVLHSRKRVAWAWAVWLAVVLGLFNGCAGHRESGETGKWLDAGGWPISLGTGVRALRALGTDDADLQRYHAYANAVLGLPYQATFVRPFEGWKVDARLLANNLDAADPAVTPPVVPARPLIPYRDFLVEYPPGFFLFAVPPALVARGLDAYYFLFSSFMALLLTAALALLWDAAKRIAPDRATSLVFFAATAALAVGPIVVRRYDAVVSLSLCLLFWGCVTKRAWAAGVGLGLGVAAKGMPLLLSPVLLVYFIADNRRKDAVWTGVIAAVIGVAAVAPFAQSAGVHMLDMFAYHGQRPLQIESTGGALLVLGRAFDPSFASASQTFGSMNVVGPWDGPLKLLASLAPLVALVAVTALAWSDLRRAASDAARGAVLLRASCAALAFFMVLGKVFSPQYLTWLLPLGMLASLLAPGVAARRTLLGALVLTQVIWPTCYSIKLASNLSPFFGALVLARNALVFAWAWQLATLERAERVVVTQSASVASAKSTVASSR
jgi:hypothetical protein